MCEFLRLELEIYGPKQGGVEIRYSTIQGQTRGYTGNHPVGSLVISNKGAHWERLLTDLDAVNAHNWDYENLPSRLVNLATPAEVVQRVLQDFGRAAPPTAFASQAEESAKPNVNSKESSSNKGTAQDNIQVEVEAIPLGELLAHYKDGWQPPKGRFSYIQALALQGIQMLGYQKTDATTRLTFEKAQNYIHTVNVPELKTLIKEYPGIVRAIDQKGNTLLHYVTLTQSKVMQLSINLETYSKVLLKEDKCTLVVKELFNAIWHSDQAIYHKKIESYFETLSRDAIDQNTVANLKKEIQIFIVLIQNIGKFTKEEEFFDKLDTKTSIILKLLLDAGADVNIKNNVSATPLHLAALLDKKISGKREQNLACLLIDHGAIASPDIAGFTPLHFAATTNNVAAITALLEAKVYVDIVSLHGLTPLHLAALSRQADAFKLLHARGASVAHKAYPHALEQLQFHMPHKHATSLGFALERGNNEIVNYIVDYLLTQKKCSN